jgi:hypothetical protein
MAPVFWNVKLILIRYIYLYMLFFYFKLLIIKIKKDGWYECREKECVDRESIGESELCHLPGNQTPCYSYTDAVSLIFFFLFLN